MFEIHSINEVRSYINRIRSLKKGFITNFYPDPKKIEIWTMHHSLYVIEYDEVIIFIKNDDGFKYLFYCATDKDVLNEALSSLPSEEVYIFDQIVDARTDATLINSFEKSGFSIRKSLVRMSKIYEKNGISKNDDRFAASYKDLSIIDEMLHRYFDKYSEQLPSKEELVEFLQLNHIIILKKDDEIAGFIIYEQSPSSLYLRYWLVNPKFRDQGIGSCLFNEFQNRGASCRRHMLWVVEDNQNAIKRYEHYGFSRENMKDYVLIKK